MIAKIPHLGQLHNQTLIPAAGYGRASSDKQETSVDDQRAAILRWAAEHGFEIVRWFIDDGVSGWKDDERRGFQKMIEASGAGEFKAVIVWKQNRFSRLKPRKFLRYIDMLEDNGVSMWALDKGRFDPDDIASLITGVVESHGDAEYSSKLGQDIYRGQCALAERGFWLSGPAPLGFSLSEKEIGGRKGRRLVVGSREEGELLSRIFALCISGWSAGRIASELNRDGVMSYSARRGIRQKKGFEHLPREQRPYVTDLWSEQTILGILRNDVFTGTYRWGRTNHAQFAEGGNLVFIADNHLALIDKATFDKAQRVLARKAGNKRVQRPASLRAELVLSGLLECGKCGGPMHSAIHKPGFARYVCANHESFGEHRCEGNSVHQADVLTNVIRSIEQHFGSDDVRSSLHDELVLLLSPTHDEITPDEIRRLLKQSEANLSKARRNIGLVDPENIPFVQATIRDESARQSELKKMLTTAATPREAISQQAAALVEESLSSFADLRTAFEQNDWPELQSLLTQCVSRIEVWAYRGLESTTEERLYELMRKVPEFTPAEAAHRLGELLGRPVPSKAAARWLGVLAERGSAVMLAPHSGARASLWQLTGVEPTRTAGRARYDLRRGHIYLNNPLGTPSDSQDQNVPATFKRGCQVELSRDTNVLMLEFVVQSITA